MKYRAEIDGLRAVAVIPVVLFHAGLGALKGGFIGVDIFFVISGYLITTILIEEIEQKRFTLIGFYERRARRILPALFLVMLTCTPLAWHWAPPSHMKDFSESLIAVSLFISNILFWNESGYFDTAADQKPLLHTWSLAVEEQYYLVFPLMLIVLLRYGRNRTLWAIIFVAAISLLLTEWGWRHKPTANFFLAPTRVWELFAGSIAALIVLKRDVRASQPLSILGIVLISLSIAFFDEHTPTPSKYTTIPVAGVMLLLIFTSNDTLVGKILGGKFLVGIGLLSYSIYLWHQPLFAFARLPAGMHPSPMKMILLCVLSTLLAYASWRFVERPFRSRSMINRSQIFMFSALGMTTFIVLGAVGVQTNGYLNPQYDLAPNVEWRSLGEKIQIVGDVCDRNSTYPGYENVLGCHFGRKDSAKSIVLLGDSHSQSISHYLDDALNERGIKGVYLSIRDCEPIPYIYRDQPPNPIRCDQRFEELTHLLETLGSPVIVLNRWTFRLYPIPGYIEDMPYRSQAGTVENEEYREYFVQEDNQYTVNVDSKTRALTSYIRHLARAAPQLILIYPIPETTIDIEAANRAHFQRNRETLTNIMTPYSDYTYRNKLVLQLFDQLKQPNIRKLRVSEFFCKEHLCYMQKDNSPLYYDDDHLSYEGARLVVDSALYHIETAFNMR